MAGPPAPPPHGQPPGDGTEQIDTAQPRERIWDLCLAIAAGGALGGAARHGLNRVLDHEPDELPWSTFLENVTGSFVLAAVTVLLLKLWPPNRYLRPFLGVGMLGGFTTFSAFTTEVRVLLAEGEGAYALLYLFGSPAVALGAVVLGTIAAEALVRARGRGTA